MFQSVNLVIKEFFFLKNSGYLYIERVIDILIMHPPLSPKYFGKGRKPKIISFCSADQKMSIYIIPNSLDGTL